MRTLEMVRLRPKRASASRPRGSALVVERSLPSERSRSLIVLRDGRVLDAQGNAEDNVVYVRDAGDLRAVRELRDVAPPITAHPNKPLMLGGVRTHLRLIDIESGETREHYPLQAPGVWIDDDRFVARSMGFDSGRRAIDPYFATRRDIVDLFTDKHADGVVIINVATGTAQVCTRWTYHDNWSYRHHLDVVGDILLWGAFLDVGAVRLPDWNVLWTWQNSGTHGGGYNMRAIAASAAGEHVAVAAGGTDGDKDLLVFAVKTGKLVLQLPLAAIVVESGMLKSKRTEITCIAWHPRGWLAAGTRGGLVAHVSLGGAVDVYRAAPRAIEALAFSHDGARLLVASVAGIATFPLTPDEFQG